MIAFSIYTYTDIIHFSPFIKEYPNDVHVFVIRKYFGQKRGITKKLIYFSDKEFEIIKKYFTETLGAKHYKEFDNFQECKAFCIKNKCKHFMNSGRDFEQGHIAQHHHLFSRVNEGISLNLTENLMKPGIFNPSNMTIYTYGPAWYNSKMQKMLDPRYLSFYNTHAYIQDNYFPTYEKPEFKHSLFDKNKQTIYVPIRHIYLDFNSYRNQAMRLLTDLSKYSDQYNIIVRMRPGVTYSQRTPYDQMYDDLAKKCNKYGFIIDDVMFDWPIRQTFMANLADIFISPTICGMINEAFLANKPYITMHPAKKHIWPNDTKFLSYEHAVNNNLLINYHQIDLSDISSIKFNPIQFLELQNWKNIYLKYVDLKDVMTKML